MERLNPAEAQYRVLFMEFDEKEQRLAQVERQRDAAFEEFTSIQGSMIEQADQVRMLREMWGDDAFADYGTVAEFMIDVSGLDPVVDTTDASGSVLMSMRPPGSTGCTRAGSAPSTNSTGTCRSRWKASP